MRYPCVLGLLAITIAACARPATPASQPVAGTVPILLQAPTRPDSECGLERAQALSGSPVAGLHPPVPDRIILPPHDLPSDVRGETRLLLLLVDEHGRVVRDSSDAPISRDTVWANEFRRRLRHYAFQPAILNGCAVPAWARIRMTF